MKRPHIRHLEWNFLAHLFHLSDYSLTLSLVFDDLSALHYELGMFECSYMLQWISRHSNDVSQLPDFERSDFRLHSPNSSAALLVAARIISIGVIPSAA